MTPPPRPGRTVMRLLLLLSLVSCSGDEGRRAPTDYNVLLVTLDTTRADRIGAFGGSSVPTPNLDRAAREGVRFLKAVSPVPLTLPAHTSMFTGQYSFRHGVRHNGAFRVPPSSVTLAERMREAGFRTGAFVGAYVLDGSFGLDQGFETYSSVPNSGSTPDLLHTSEVQRPAAAVNEAALRWIGAAEARPFFAWVHYYDPHHPYAPPEEPSIPLRGTGYDREISYVDHCFGQLLASLREKGLLDRTILVVAGDHGESLGSHGEETHGIFLYEPALHVPFFVRAPGVVEAGDTYDSPVSLVDLAPTVLSLVRLAPLQGSDGIGLLTASGRLVPEQPDRLVYGETQMPRIELGWSDLAMVRDGSYKYIRAPRPELYDLVRDATETTNVLEVDPEAAVDLARALDATLSGGGTTDPQMTENVLSAEEMAKLQSLGYLRSGANVSSQGTGSAALPDPKDRLGEMARLEEAATLLDRGDIDDAVAAFEEATKGNPRNHTALQGRARALLRRGDLKAAEEAALAALAAAGSDRGVPPPLADNARALLATILSLEGRREEAANALRSTPDRAGKPAHRSPTSVLLAAAKNDDEEEAIVRIATERFPRDPWTWAAMLEHARRGGNEEKIERARRQLRDLGPKSASALIDAGVRAQEARDLPRATMLFETALEVEPRHPDVLGYLGAARLQAGDLSGAEEAFLRAGALRPQDPRVPTYLANIALLRNDEQKAKDLIATALEKSPQFVPPLLNYARWLDQKGRTAEAIRVAESALARRPQDRDAETLLHELRKQPGQEGG